MSEPAATTGKLPRQIPFIIGNEAAERFSFYGMRNVLTDFLSGYLLVSLAAAERGDAAKEVFHVFVMGVYFFPLLGGWLADRFFGKYRIILGLSIVYCVGQLLLALSIDSKEGFYAGLFLIALGSGGIKPCVSAFVGDQFDQSNKHLAKVVFDFFYFAINFGSLFASLFIPGLLKSGHVRLAFAVPAMLMALSVVVFVAGRNRYVRLVPPKLPVAWGAVLRFVIGIAPAVALFVVGQSTWSPWVVIGVPVALSTLSLARPSWNRASSRIIPAAVMVAAVTFALSPDAWFGVHLVVGAALVAASFDGFVSGKRMSSDGFLAVSQTVLFGGKPGPSTALALAGLFLSLCAFGLTHQLGVVPVICLALVIFLVFAGVGVALNLRAARGSHSDEAIDGVGSVLRVLIIFALVTPFWSLFDQKASTWILQGKTMELPGWGWFTTASQMQALNPLLVMILIPFNNIVLYPSLRRANVNVTALRRMGFGIAFSGLAWIAVATLQLKLDRGTPVSILWQVLPYALLTFGEVLVSATGLEFAYSQAPARMKGVLMAFWSLSVTIGNLWVLLVNAGVKNDTVTHAIEGQGWGVMATQMYFFALFAFVAAAAFAAYAMKYRVVDHYRSEPAQPLQTPRELK